ncbi:hypothetical protein [Fibrobacter sp.]|uniref:hypothetical protein n=1 Tax=Fibrobacter sp. TaxID=35828 RepID=UPI0025C04F35|nr:hypothetical protein [Fibrobacter sp.]MBR4007607.1 hypothetical protein [Fibrobacter sp.]
MKANRSLASRETANRAAGRDGSMAAANSFVLSYPICFVSFRTAKMTSGLTSSWYTLGSNATSGFSRR